VESKKGRKIWNTSIKSDIATRFRLHCNEIGVAQNIIIESFMNAFVEDRFVLVFKDGVFDIKEKINQV